MSRYFEVKLVSVTFYHLKNNQKGQLYVTSSFKINKNLYHPYHLSKLLGKKEIKSDHNLL